MKITEDVRKYADRLEETESEGDNKETLTPAH